MLTVILIAVAYTLGFFTCAIIAGSRGPVKEVDEWGFGLPEGSAYDDRDQT